MAEFSVNPPAARTHRAILQLSMDFFGLPSQRAELETPLADPAQEVRRLVTRAWYLRQADPGTAVADATTAHMLLRSLPAAQAQRATARLALVQAENAWLFGEVDRAGALIGEARGIFEWAHDPIGLGDSWLAQADVLEQRGAGGREAVVAAQQCYLGAAQAAAQSGDAVRLLLCDARLASLDAASTPGDAPPRWAELLEAAHRIEHPGIDLYVEAGLATLACVRGEPTAQIEHLQRCQSAALEAGRLHMAVSAAQQIANGYGALHDHDGAMLWAERARRLVQPTGWPILSGWCTVQSAALLLAREQFAEAAALLAENMPMQQRFAAAPHYAQACRLLGQALLAQHRPEEALPWLETGERVAVLLRLPELVSGCLCDKGEALSQLARADDAMQALQAALHTAQDHADVRGESNLRRELARVARIHGLTRVPSLNGSDAGAASAALAHMQAALAAGERIPGFSTPAAWYAELAEDLFGAGQLADAYRYQSLAAARAAEEHVRRFSALNAALELRHRSESQCMTTLQQRNLLHARQERVAALAAGEATLAHLVDLYGGVAAAGDAAGALAALGRYLPTLMDVHQVAVWLLRPTSDPHARALQRLWALEDGAELPVVELSEHAPHHPLWRCLRENVVLTVDPDSVNALTSTPVETSPSHLPEEPAPRDLKAAIARRQRPMPPPIPALAPFLSLLLAPMAAHGEVLGVLAVQSQRSDAFAEHEALVLRTAATAIASALQRPGAAPPSAAAVDPRLDGLLGQAGKLAAVGRLADAMLREMGPSVQALAAQADALGPELERHHLHGPAAAVRHMQRDTAHLAQVLGRLRPLAGPRAPVPELGAQDLRSVLTQARTLYGPRLVQDHIACDDSVPSLQVHADTEQLSVAIAQLVFNAADALEGRADKHVWLRAQRTGDDIELSVCDNGPGLAHETTRHLFEPFFTTKPEGSSLGLGLALSAEAVAGMKGHIRGENTAAGGAIFTIVLPAA